jgi:hypothetical protein
MSELPQPQEVDIRDWVGEKSFERGRAYFLQGAILKPSHEGTVLKATCMGSTEKDYRLFADLRPDGIYAAHCSCPVGAGGRCKHIAALLLTWLDDPASFVETEPIQKIVGSMSKEELVDLVLQMVATDPDLESLVRLNEFAVVEGGQPVDQEGIRGWAERAIVKNQEGLGNPLEIVANLQPILDLGERYERKGSVQNAAIVFRTLALTVLDYDLSLLQDEEGYLHGIVRQCVHSLGNCLSAIPDSAARRQILEALFDIYTWDVNSGSLGAGSAVPDIFLQQAEREERERICRWIQDQLPAGDSWQERYLRHLWGTLWLDLEAEWLDDAAFLQICRQAGLVAPLVDRLVQAGQVDEAYREARQASDEELLSLADLLAARGETRLARILIEERAQTGQDMRFTDWLAKNIKNG